MPLSAAQENYNHNQFYLLISKSDEQEFAALQVLWAKVNLVCHEAEIILNTDPQSSYRAHIRTLLELLKRRDQLEEASFEQNLRTWAAAYKKTEQEAGETGRLLHATQAKGIVRSLREDSQLNPRAWCEDIDLAQALKGIMLTPEEVTTSGIQILPPVDLSSPEFLKNQIATVLAKDITGPLTLLTPVSYGGHWRLAKIKIEDKQISSASLWDSLGDHFLQEHPAYLNMQTALEQIQPGLKVSTGPERALQTNSWSCGDYVVQEALREKYGVDELNLDEVNLVTLWTVNEPVQLRAALVEQIKSFEPIQEVKEQAKKPGTRLGLFNYLAQNKAAQVTFDEVMARALDRLYRENPNEEDEKKLISQARAFALQQCKDSYPELPDEEGLPSKMMRR